jgi:hypothetical protein
MTGSYISNQLHPAVLLQKELEVLHSISNFEETISSGNLKDQSLKVHCQLVKRAGACKPLQPESRGDVGSMVCANS